jgi:hypothetical protein
MDCGYCAIWNENKLDEREEMYKLAEQPIVVPSVLGHCIVWPSNQQINIGQFKMPLSGDSQVLETANGLVSTLRAAFGHTTNEFRPGK